MRACTRPRRALYAFCCRAGDLIDAWHSYTGGMFEVPGTPQYSQPSPISLQLNRKDVLFTNQLACAQWHMGSRARRNLCVCVCARLVQAPRAAATTRWITQWWSWATARRRRARTTGWLKTAGACAGGEAGFFRCAHARLPGRAFPSQCPAVNNPKGHLSKSSCCSRHHSLLYVQRAMRPATCSTRQHVYP